MPELETPFGGVEQVFEEHYDEVRGYVREQVTHYNLDDLLRLSRRKPIRVLDMEGGTGRDASWLANLGHKVILMDSNPNQLAAAHERPELEKSSIIQGDIDMALKLFEDTRFDLVLSHGVDMYQKDPEEYFKKLTRLVRPLGNLSLLTAGFYGKQIRYHGDAVRLIGLQTTSTYQNNLALKAIARRPVEIQDLFKRVGFRKVDWFGVRFGADSDKRKVADLNPAELALLMQPEIELSREPSTKGTGQMLHFIGNKPAGRI